ncbi:hypothetical protein [Nostocoides sp.]|uniref:hypothetical protein n=1 Tax=Nostocoides sp. TaxID=1917966 RepID=UPI003BAF75D7
MTLPADAEVAVAARTGYERGDHVFCCALTLDPPLTTGAVPEWSLTVSAVEEVGWVLEHWSVSQNHLLGVRAFPLFRRRD